MRRTTTTPQLILRSIRSSSRHKVAIVMTNNWIQIKLYPQCVTAQLPRTETQTASVEFELLEFILCFC